ncbi:MAG TPA: hypothetical protein VEQ85_07300, partial [Lacipirellulaceae bacterium]|nr:hypothetical protein [Lacipirellulaceae bacterium]
DYAKLESAAWWLAATGQAPGALAAARSRFNQPQVVFQFHRELIEDKLAQFQNETREQRPTRNRIQGTLVTGTATVQSLTTAQLSAAGSPDVRLQIMTRGTVAAPHNVANSGRVRVASSASSEFTVSAEIYFDGQKFAATAPLAQADTSTRIKSVAAPRIIRRAAARRAQASRAGAESEGASLIEREAVASMEKRLATAVEKLNAKAAGFLNFMRRIGNWPAQPWVTQLTSTAVQVGHHPRSIAGLGALPHQMPPFSGQETLGLSFHDGGLEGILTPQVAGKVWTDVNFAMLQRELTGGYTEEFLIGLDPGRWSAQWAWHAPVRIHFTAEHASIRYRFDAVEIDGAKYEAPFEVRARVTLSAPPLGFEMHMLEPAAVASLDPGNPLPPHFQAFLERKFRGLFGMHFSLDGMQFPAGGALDGMSAFRVAAIHLEPNWVHLRYTNRKPQATLVRGETAPSPAEPRP